MTNETMTAAASENVVSTPAQHTPGPWEYVASTEHHGPYVASPYGNDICDCYTMSNPSAPAFCNGGDSKPIHFMHEMADANARLIAAAPDLLSAAQAALKWADDLKPYAEDGTIVVPVFEGLRAAIAKATGGRVTDAELQNSTAGHEP